MGYIFLVLPFFFMYPSVKAIYLDYEGKVFVLSAFFLCCLGGGLYLFLIATPAGHLKGLVFFIYISLCLLLLFKRSVIFHEKIWWRSNPSNIFEWVVALVSLSAIVILIILMALNL